MRNGYVLDWILEASTLLKEALHDELREDSIAPHFAHTDIWHQRVKNLLKPIHIEAPKDTNNG